MTSQMAIAKKAHALLALERRIVGVKLIYDKHEYEAITALEPKVPISYCQAVRAATAGNAVKFTKEKSGCRGSSKALGFNPPPDDYYTGDTGYNMGLYDSTEVAKSVANVVRICTRPIYGVAVKPLEQFEVTPDVVIIIANTREAMRVMQGYTCVYGVQQEFNITGNQAICMECTSYPYLRQCINLSMLCSGTRHKAGWKDGEVAIGVPYARFEGVVQGLQSTVNAIERNPRKAQIEQAYKENDLGDIDVVYGRTYFLQNDTSPKE